MKRNFKVRLIVHHVRYQCTQIKFSYTLSVGITYCKVVLCWFKDNRKGSHPNIKKAYSVAGSIVKSKTYKNGLYTRFLILVCPRFVNCICVVLGVNISSMKTNCNSTLIGYKVRDLARKVKFFFFIISRAVVSQSV